MYLGNTYKSCSNVPYNIGNFEVIRSVYNCINSYRNDQNSQRIPAMLTTTIQKSIMRVMYLIRYKKPIQKNSSKTMGAITD